MRILVIMRLGDVKAADKLQPLLRSQLVTEVILVRHAPVSIESPKLRQVIHRVGLSDDATRQSWLAAGLNVFACFWNGLRVARHVQPDVVVSYNAVPYGLIAWAVGRLTGARVVLSLIGTDFNRWVQRSRARPVLRRWLKVTDAVCVFGPEAKRELVARGIRDDRVYVLPNTIDTAIFHPAPGNVPPVYDLVYVGYLREGKRVDLVLETLREVHRQRPETSLLIVGEGSERERLESLARDIGVSDRVTFYGHSRRVVDLLRSARVFIMLSEREGMPLAMLEAMAVGLPPVVTDVGAIGSIVRQGVNGYLVHIPVQPDEVAGYVLRLLTDKTHYEDARREAQSDGSRYGYDVTARVWDDILASLKRRL